MNAEMTLDEAWRRLEPLLSDGGTLAIRVFTPTEGFAEWTVEHSVRLSYGRGGASRYRRTYGDGPTFVAALLALTARLQEQPR